MVTPLVRYGSNPCDAHIGIKGFHTTTYNNTSVIAAKIAANKIAFFISDIILNPFRGLNFMTLGSVGVNPNTMAGIPSVAMFNHKIWIASKGCAR